MAELGSIQAGTVSFLEKSFTKKRARLHIFFLSFFSLRYGNFSKVPSKGLKKFRPPYLDTMTDALSYDITDDQLKTSYNKMKKENNVEDFRAQILHDTASILEGHEYFDNIELDTDNTPASFREDELVGVMTAIDTLVEDLVQIHDMSRFDHLKAAITGGVQ